MGNSPSLTVGGCHTSSPNYENKCNDDVGDEIESSGFCTFSGDSGLSRRRTYCERIGDDEWTYSGQGMSCNYNDCHPDSSMGACCNGAGCCGIAGNATRCRRVVFKGDPLTCCLRDMACNKTLNEEFCFENSKKERTCAPENRDQASSGCRKRMFDYCTGADVPPGKSNEWIKRWTGDVEVGGVTYSRPCYQNLYRNLYNGQSVGCLKEPIPGGGVVNTEGYRYDQELINAMINRYLQDGGNLASLESSESNNRLNDMIWSVCNTTPGLCSNALFNYCVNVTPETLSRNTALLPWCGCYMSEDKYAKYTQLYGINRECTPTCNMKGTIPLPSVDGNGKKRCKQTTCIIDNVSINIANSIVGGTGTGINFNQLCSSCAESNGGTCNCTITNTTLDIINAQTGNINISQQCTGNSVCYKEEKLPDGTTTVTKVPCIDDGSIDPYIEVQRQTQENLENAIWRRNMLILLIFVLLVIFIVILWFILKPKPTSEKTKTAIIDR